MTVSQHLITILICALATILTRFLPFLIFSSRHKLPGFVQYLGKALPAALFGMLVVYCLKGVDILSGSHGLPELLAIALVIILHLWKRQMLLSIAGGTVFYMLMLQMIF